MRRQQDLLKAEIKGQEEARERIAREKRIREDAERDLFKLRMEEMQRAQEAKIAAEKTARGRLDEERKA